MQWHVILCYKCQVSYRLSHQNVICDKNDALSSGQTFYSQQQWKQQLLATIRVANQQKKNNYRYWFDDKICLLTSARISIANIFHTETANVQRWKTRSCFTNKNHTVVWTQLEIWQYSYRHGKLYYVPSVSRRVGCHIDIGLTIKMLTQRSYYRKERHCLRRLKSV